MITSVRGRGRVFDGASSRRSSRQTRLFRLRSPSKGGDALRRKYWWPPLKLTSSDRIAAPCAKSKLSLRAGLMRKVSRHSYSTLSVAKRAEPGMHLVEETDGAGRFLFSGWPITSNLSFVALLASFGHRRVQLSERRVMRRGSWGQRWAAPCMREGIYVGRPAVRVAETFNVCWVP
jgi:hypothetical protein